MAIIYKCDICEKEFVPERNMMNGEAMFSVFHHYSKKTLMSKENPTPQTRMEVKPRMLCLECSKKVDDKIIEMENENKTEN